jgi:hypothetical protein
MVEHASDCATHNAPAMEPGACDCGAEPKARWALVEILGHRSRAGRVTQVQEFGAVMLRIEIPLRDGGFATEDYGGSSIYGIRWCTEDVARAAAFQDSDVRPVMPVDWRERQQFTPAIEHRSTFEDDDWDAHDD